MKILLILFFSISTFANVTLSDCSEMATNYFSTEGVPTKIPDDCAKLILEIKDDRVFAKSEDGQTTISAYKNIIYINDNGINRFIAGNLSRLHNIISLVFQEDESRIFVLNENQQRQREVLSFKYNLSGNVSPIRSLETREIEFATNIKVKGKYIHVTSTSHDWEKVFNKEADPNGKKEENSSIVLREVSGSFD